VDGRDPKPRCEAIARMLYPFDVGAGGRSGIVNALDELLKRPPRRPQSRLRILGTGPNEPQVGGNEVIEPGAHDLAHIWTPSAQGGARTTGSTPSSCRVLEPPASSAPTWWGASSRTHTFGSVIAIANGRIGWEVPDEQGGTWKT